MLLRRLNLQAAGPCLITKPFNQYMASILLIRHGSSRFHQFREYLFLISNDKVYARFVAQQFCYPHFVDCQVTLVSRKFEVAKIKKDSGELLSKVKVALTSPAIRAIETTTLLFEDEIKSGKVKVIVHPQARPRLTNTYACPIKWVQERENYPQFDWTLMEGLEYDNLLWMTRQYSPTNSNQRLRQALFDNRKSALMDQAKVLTTQRSKSDKMLSEIQTDFYQRIVELENWILGYVEANKLKPHELVLIGHNYSLELIKANRFFNGKQLGLDYPAFDNMEVISAQIKRLFRF